MLDLHNKVPLPKSKGYDFFRNNNLSEWTFSSFKQHKLNNARIKPSMSAIINQYKQHLTDISGTIKDKDLKKYIASLLEDVGDRSTEEQSGFTLSNCSNVNIASINYGTQVSSPEHSNKKRKIIEEPASPLPSTPSVSSLRNLAQNETLCYDTDDEFESEEEMQVVVEEDVKFGIWELWKKVLENMQAQNDIDKYSLENLNIIQLGNKIGSESTRKYYPKDLIDKTDIIIKNTPDFFVKDQDFYNRIFDTIILADEQSSNELLAEVYLKVLESKDPFMTFFHTVVQAFVSELFIKDSDVYQLEVIYNYRIVWPIIDCLSKLIKATRFRPGEVRLQAICDELKLMNKDTNSFYNADGVIFNTEHKIEVAIIETTGPFHILNNSKETQDYIKAGYGLVSMLHYIGRKYTYGDFDIFKRIGVFFVQVTPTKLRIWRVSMPHSKLYVKNCIGSVKKMIQESYEAIEALKNSHINKMKIKARKGPGYESICEIQDNFKKNAVIKLPNVYIQKTDKFKMNSSPLRPDD
ncbi:hypothetical protein EDC96DRAFT_9902 [Choanephora cucurbitarum]|nr:hypothetical protein EDC96DRAFT_9902 [Choanephora cucurbitarum]